MVRRIVVTGYARLPGGISSRSLYEYLTVGALVERESHTILRGTSTLSTEVGRHWLEEAMFGVNVLQEPSPFLELIERDYWGSAGPAIVSAYKDMVSRYQQRVLDEDKKARKG